MTELHTAHLTIIFVFPPPPSPPPPYLEARKNNAHTPVYHSAMIVCVIFSYYCTTLSYISIYYYVQFSLLLFTYVFYRSIFVPVVFFLFLLLLVYRNLISLFCFSLSFSFSFSVVPVYYFMCMNAIT